MAKNETNSEYSTQPRTELQESEHLEEVTTQSSWISRMRIFGGFVSVGFASAIFMGGLNYGEYRRTVDSNVAAIKDNKIEIEAKVTKSDKRIDAILEHLKKSDLVQTEILVTMKSRDEFYLRVLEQQGSSDAGFMKVIKDIRDGVNNNSKSILNIYQNFKTSEIDNTGIDFVAMGTK